MTCNFRTFIWLIVIHIIVNVAARQKTRLLLFQDVAITFNKDYFSQYSFDIAEDRQGFNCEVMVIKNITQPVWNKLSIEMKGKREESYKSIFNYEINVCDFLGVTGRTSSTNMIALWIQNILKYSNLPKSCPVLVGTYGWENFKVEKSSIPAFALNGLYRINISNYLKTIATGKLLITDTTLRVVIKMK